MDEAPKRIPPEDLSLQEHRRIIGTIGFFLPALVYLFAAARPTAGLDRWQLLWSISAYYYTGAVGVFVGALFALSLFLFSYRGYKGVVADRIVGGIGGVAAMVVALFPTAAPGDLRAPTWWSDWTAVLHYVGATVLFLAFIVFALWLFRRSDVPRRRDRTPDKRFRDDVCLVCGLVMVACVTWAAIAKYLDRPIFWPESIAVVAFAISWLVKGEAHKPIVRRARILMHRDAGPRV
jgi:hypothetical protein